MPEAKIVQRPSKMPDSFSVESKVQRITTSERRGGVVFDSFDELAKALKGFESSSIFRQGSPNNVLLNDVEASTRAAGNDPSMATGFVLLGMAMQGRSTPSIADQLIAKAGETEKRLEGNGYLASDSFEYDAMGTSFFKTSVRMLKQSGKYVLELNQAYKGSQIEDEITKATGTHKALSWAFVDVSYSSLDDLWFNIDVAPYAQVFGLRTNKEMKHLASSFLNASAIESVESPKLPFSYEGREFTAKITVPGVANSRELAGNDGGEWVRLIKSHDTRIFGGANWKEYDGETGKRLPEGYILPAKPFLLITIDTQKPSNEYTSFVAAAKEDIALVLAARDHLRGQLSEKLRVN